MGIADGEVTTMALCWRIERPDGAGLALTSHDRTMTIDGIEHRPAPGIVPGTVTRRLGLEPHSGEIAGALSHDAIEERDLAVGRWDGSRVALRAIDWSAPDEGQILLIGGTLGNVVMKDSEFTADLNGAAARLDQPVCPATSAECRAEFGDKKCTIDLAGRTIIASVVAANGTAFTIDQTVDDRFVLGRLRYLDGENCGATSVVLTASGTSVQVRDFPKGAVLGGAKLELREGCDKRFETCVTRFANAVNFRGEPHLPGNDLLTRYPGA